MPKITRAALYGLVWKTPVHTLAPEFGISNVGLAKLCRRNGIPLLPRGYWAKLQFGKRVRRPPLPAPSEGQREELTIEATPPREALPDLPPEIAAAIEAEQSAEPIVVAPSPKPHPIAASWERARQPSYGPPNFTPETEARRRRTASVLLKLSQTPSIQIVRVRKPIGPPVEVHRLIACNRRCGTR